MWFGPTAPGRRSELVLPTLRCWQSVRAAGGNNLSSSSFNDSVGGGVSGVPLAMGKTPMGVAVSSDPSWVVGSTRTAAQWRGDG
jgi:hypothetical protein